VWPRLRFSNNKILDVSDLFDLYPHAVALLQPQGGLAGRTYASWCTRKDYVARFECHDLREMLDHGGTVENEVSGSGLLALLAVYQAADTKVIDVNRVCRDDPWPEGCMGVEGFFPG
jgi:hypothetical protein